MSKFKDQVDKEFLSIAVNLLKDVVADTQQAAGQIVGLTPYYMERDTQEALQNFYHLYFSTSQKLEAEKLQVDQEVDDLVAKLLDARQAGGDVDAVSALVTEDEEIKKRRLSLSGVQKQLEAIISLDANIREQLIPVLSSVQFEDFIRQRIQHIIDAWSRLIPAASAGGDLAPHLENIAEMLTSQEERDLYYKVVLKRKAPECLSSSENWLENLFEKEAV